MTTTDTFRMRAENRPCRQRRRARRGAAAVEFALAAPVLLLLALGCVDFGRVFYTYYAVSNAARSGAEYGATHNPTPTTRTAWEAAIRAVVDGEMQGWTGYQSQQLTLDISTTSEANNLYRVAVETSCPFQTVVDWPGVPSTTTLSHRVEMRRIH